MNATYREGVPNERLVIEIYDQDNNTLNPEKDDFLGAILFPIDQLKSMPTDKLQYWSSNLHGKYSSSRYDLIVDQSIYLSIDQCCTLVYLSI